jgi:hypothetical protein
MFQLPQLHRPCLTGRALCSMLTLVTYGVAAVGVPMGGSHGGPSTGCRCSNDLKTAGDSQCGKRPSTISESEGKHSGLDSQRSCCVRNAAQTQRSKSRTVSPCCSGKSSELQPKSRKLCCVPAGRQHGKQSDEPAANPDGDMKTEVPGYPAITACTCGGDPSVGFMCNMDPRLPGDSVRVLPDGDWHKKWESACEIPPDHCVAPETPPPKVAA